MIAVHPTRYDLTTGRPTVALNGDPALAHALLVALGITAIVGWLLSVVCVAVPRDAQTSLPPICASDGPSPSSSPHFWWLCSWPTRPGGVSLVLQGHQAGGGAFTTITFPDQALWLPLVVALAVATLLATTRAKVAVRSWRVVALRFG